jgi:DNA-binding beta-propeller fold protein YncE
MPPTTTAQASLPWGSCSTATARATFEAGRRAVVAGQSDEAVALLDRCLVEDPTCLACQFQLGWAYWVKEDWGLAAIAFDKTLALRPGHRAARKYAALAREREGMESDELGDAPTRPAVQPDATDAAPPTPVVVMPPVPMVETTRPSADAPAMAVSPIAPARPASAAVVPPPAGGATPAMPPTAAGPDAPVVLPRPREPVVAARDRARLTLAEALAGPDQLLSVPLGTRGRSEQRVSGGPRLHLVARWQGFGASTADGDHFDLDINSPKSVRFARNGSKVYVNSLEGYRTVVFDPARLEKTGVIQHAFTKADAALFHGENTVFGYVYRQASASKDPNIMRGKPVESALSHAGRWLWVPYYRRDFDRGSTSPSAVAIIDTTTDRVVRVMPTGPIPKFVAVSPDDRFVAVTHWGDNTLGIIDVSSGEPAAFRYLERRLVVGTALSMDRLQGIDRDKDCGSCLRGTLFTPDGRTLLVARMGSGGIAAFDTATWSYLGTVTGEKPSPRHLVVSKDGRWLYVSANASGFIGRAPLAEFVATARSAGGQTVRFPAWHDVHVGGGARTIELSPDDRWLYVASNSRAQIVVVDTLTMSVVHRIRTDAYTVGLAVSPDGSQVWTTSQGNHKSGGRSVGVYAVHFDDDPATTGTSTLLAAAAPPPTKAVRRATPDDTLAGALTTVPPASVLPRTTVGTVASASTATTPTATMTATTMTATTATPACRLTRPTKVWLRGTFVELPTGTPLAKLSEQGPVAHFAEVRTPAGVGRIHEQLLAQRCTG